MSSFSSILKIFIILGCLFIIISCKPKNNTKTGSQDSIKTIVKINKKGQRLKILDSDHLLIDASSDFMLLFWFRLKNLPFQGEKIRILEKYNPDLKGLPGYALQIKRVSEGVRPEIYWKDKEGKGRWYSYSAFKLLPRRWTLFALSLHDKQMLGLHSIQLKRQGKISYNILGAYDLNREIYPNTTKDLEIGSLRDKRFKGLLGPIAIIKTNDLANKFEAIFSSIIENPKEFPEIVKKDRVLFIDRFNDDLIHESK